MQLAIVLTKVSLLKRQSVHLCFCFFFEDDDSNSKTYRVHINIRYFHWRFSDLLSG